jgi:peptidyl-dipeptidase Dcp
MKINITLITLLAAVVAISSCTKNENQKEKEVKKNILLEPWDGSFGGVPAFDKVNVNDFAPAIEQAIASKEAEIAAIAAHGDTAPNFENTVVALEESGQELSRVLTLYYVWGSNMSSPEFEKIEVELEPKIAAHQDRIIQNKALFKRIEAVYRSEELKILNPEQQRLVWKHYNDFVLNGAQLDDDAKAKLAEVNQKLAGLYTKFSQNQLGDEGEKYVLLENEADLAGLAPALKDAAAQEAKERKMEGKWMISNTRSSVDPFLTYADNRAQRETVWRMFTNRGDNADKYDNNALIPQIMELRSQRAKLLGFPTHAHWRLSNSMAKTPENAMKLMESVWKPSLNLVKKEVADMQAIAKKEGANIAIEPWDYRYYAEKVRKARYDLDQNEIKPYMQLEKLREGMFWVAGQLFGLGFEAVNNVPVFHPDVRVWKVFNQADGSLVGLWYFDPYARKGKRSGAWMNDYRPQSRINGKEVLTIVSNNSNFVKGKAGEPILISWDDAETLFHEFGHALHGLCSNVTYPSLSGTNVARDYVEFPSQVMERWLSTNEVLQTYALHYETGKPIPMELVKKIENAAKFNQGFSTVEALGAALVDMKLHLLDTPRIDADKFERETLAALKMPKEIVMRHRMPHFGHIFSGDGYSAGYYSYLWSDVISADAYEAFTEAGGPYDKAVAKRLKDHIFSVGNSIDPAAGYRQFRGKDPDSKALMRNRGL